jgi:calcineurin-like phosphoesterase family protein
MIPNYITGAFEEFGNTGRFTESDKDHLFFTSDTHFLHENILGYCNRPFKNIKEHDEELIRRWNSKVSTDDYVFHLGDVGLGLQRELTDIMRRLNGHIFLVIGNHDWRENINSQRWRFEAMSQQVAMKVGEQQIILNHYPMLCYSGSYRKKPVWQLYGHVHTSPYSKGVDASRLFMTFPAQYDVGVDNNDFTPISYKEVEAKIIKAIEKENKKK